MSDLDLLKVATKVKRARNKNKGQRNLDLLKVCLIEKSAVAKSKKWQSRNKSEPLIKK